MKLLVKVQDTAKKILLRQQILRVGWTNSFGKHGPLLSLTFPSLADANYVAIFLVALSGSRWAFGDIGQSRVAPRISNLSLSKGVSEDLSVIRAILMQS